MTMTPKRVGIVIFDGVEILDYCGPFEVFSVATRANYSSVNADTTALFQVSLIAAASDETPGTVTVTTADGMRVLPDYSYDNSPEFDILLVPGGTGTRKEMERPSTLEFVKKQAATATLVTSVCSGALVLAKAGLLDGKTVTTHWKCLDLLQDICPACTVDRTKHWVEDGDLFTSAGISAGIDMSLKLVEHCYGEEIARSTAKWMEYPFPESNERRINLDA
jgi:transcriptional regulator GlxA family with amidase domain